MEFDYEIGVINPADRPEPPRDNETNKGTDSNPQPDGGWGWVVCASTAICNGVLFGILNSFGILYVAIREEYEKDGSNISFKTAWVGSVCTGLTFLLSIVAGIISDVIGIRKTGFIGAVTALVGIISSAFVEDLMLLYLTYGVGVGVGFSMIFSLSFVIIGHYFKRHLGLANGITAFGGPVFTIGISLGLPELLDSVGLHKTFLALSALMVTLMPCTLTWRAVHPPRTLTLARRQVKPENNSPQGGGAPNTGDVSDGNMSPGFGQRFFNADIWRNKAYIVWMLAFGLGLMGYFVPYVHLVKHADDVFPDEKSNLLILYIAASSGVSGLVVGKLADFRLVSRVRIHQVALLLYGTCTLCIPFCRTYGALVAVAVTLGLPGGVCTSLAAPVVFDLVGPHHASQAIGFMFGSMAVPITSGPPLAGLMYDKLGSYDVAFHVAGCFPLVGAFIMLFVRQPTSVIV